MRTYKISEIIYWVIALVASIEGFLHWGINESRSFLFICFAVLSILMALFRRYYRKKFNKRSKP